MKTKNALRIPLLFFGAALAAGYAVSLSPGQQYSAEGEIEVASKTLPTRLATISTNAFYVEANGPLLYKVRIWTPGRDTVYHEYAFSNRLMRILHHLPTAPISPEAADQFTKSRTSNAPGYPAFVEERNIPPTDGSQAQFVWFAYASGAFFATCTNHLMSPVWSPEDPTLRRHPFDMLTHFWLSTNAPRLPLAVSFINDGYYRSYNPATKGLDVIPLVPPFDKGYTNANYQVTSKTNTPNNEIPATFVFAVYSSPLGKGEVPFERLMVRGRTLRVSDSVPEEARMRRFDGMASVADYRIRGTVQAHGRSTEYKYAGYTITDGDWLDDSQVASVRSDLEARLKSKLEAGDTAPEPSPR